MHLHEEPIGVVERTVNVTNTTKGDSLDLKEFSMTTRISPITTSSPNLAHPHHHMGMLSNVCFAQSIRYGIRTLLTFGQAQAVRRLGF